VRRGLAGLVVAIAALDAGACQRSRDQATEAVVERAIAAKGRESKVEIDREHGEIRVTLGGAIKPAGWPAAVPVYPHAERAKIDRSDDGGDARHLSVLTGDSLADLRGFYREELAKQGWALADADAKTSAWSARRGEEAMRIAFVTRGPGKGSRAEIEYRKHS